MKVAGYTIARNLESPRQAYFNNVLKYIGVAKTSDCKNRLALLHELGHVVNGHRNLMALQFSSSRSDKLELLKAEAAAWRWAVKRLGRQFTQEEREFCLVTFGTYVEARNAAAR